MTASIDNNSNCEDTNIISTTTNLFWLKNTNKKDEQRETRIHS